MTAHHDRMLTRALGYARRGWPVFPCRPGGKEPATRHGFRDASTSHSQITFWWNRQPDANIGVATGAPGPDVLDIDQHGTAGNGFPACRRLRAAGLLSGASAVIATPGGGLHLYFAGSGQASGRLPRHHLDFRAAGGYVLVPPSQVGGKLYRLITRGTEAAGLNWSAAHEFLEPRRHAARRSSAAKAVHATRLVDWVERLEPGNRNCGLFWAACRAAESGQPGLLDDLAAAAARTGLPEREIARTIASAQRTARR